MPAVERRRLQQPQQPQQQQPEEQRPQQDARWEQGAELVETVSKRLRLAQEVPVGFGQSDGP